MIEEKTDHLNQAEIDFVSQTFTDIDRQSRCLSGYNQQYQQLSCGKFQGYSTSLLLGNEFGMYYEVLNQVLDQCAAVPQDQYLVIFLMNDRGHCKINGQSFSAGNVFYSGPGSTVTGVAGPETHSIVISLEKAFFDAILRNCYPEMKYGLMMPESGVLNKNRSDAHSLRQTITQLLTIMRATPDAVGNTPQVKNLRHSLAEMIASQIHRSFYFPRGKKTITRSHRFQIVRQASNYIHQHQEAELTVTALCRETGVRRRTLEYCFRDCIGLSPSAYLRSIRLNGIRRALISVENAHKSIGDIAAEWGVWHLSRFAQYYRNQFHELPSETRYQTSRGNC